MSEETTGQDLVCRPALAASSSCVLYEGMAKSCEGNPGTSCWESTQNLERQNAKKMQPRPQAPQIRLWPWLLMGTQVPMRQSRPRKQAYRAGKVCTLGRCNRHEGCPKSEIKGPASAWLAAKKRQTDTPLLRNAVLSNHAQQSLKPAPQRVFGPADRRSSKSVQPGPAGLAESPSHNNNAIFKNQTQHFVPSSSTVKEG